MQDTSHRRTISSRRKDGGALSFCREYVDKETPSMSVDIPTFMLGVFIYEALSLQQTAICELPDVPL